MPNIKNRKTPGVYVTELNGFPPSIVGVPTAIPAFIGYTEKAEINGKPVSLTPVEISSFEDYKQIFGSYTPVYKIISSGQGSYDFFVFDSDNNTNNYYNLAQSPDINFNLYYSLKLFYANGGENCFIISVGNYSKSVNKNDLLAGLNIINGMKGTTMLVIPDAILLPDNNDFQTVVQAMLNQCGELEDRFAILDVYNSNTVKDQVTLDSVIAQFQTNLGDNFLSYGAGYFPFLNSLIPGTKDFNYSNLALKDPYTLSTLKSVLSWDNKNNNQPGSVYDNINDIINQISSDNTVQEIAEYNAVLSVLPLYQNIINVMVSRNSILPPSGAIAGVYTLNDNNLGVWNAPANVTLSQVVNTSYKVTDQQQGDLNVPLNGKAIDVIRDFVGRGPVVWGARTFDGNNNDYRYIQVRRTLIYIEQSIKNALNQFVFAANDGQTWVAVTSMISNFLQGLWAQGGLMGDKASDAYTVQCGLGSTMTELDILDGYMVVQVTLQMIRPAEFIELTFKQKMEGGS